MRVAIVVAVCVGLAGPAGAESRSSPKRAGKAAKEASGVPSAGVKTPGVQIPMANLKYEAEFPVEAPDSITLADGVLAMSRSQNSVMRIDPKAAAPKAAAPKASAPKADEPKAGEPKAGEPKAGEPTADEPTADEKKTGEAAGPITGFSKPCSGVVSAFQSLWVPDCGAQSVRRVDLKSGKITATLAIGAADVLAGLAATGDSVWMLTDNKTTLSRIDPVANMVVAELRLPAGCSSIVSGEAALWVACPLEDKLLRVDPQTNLVDKYIEVSKGPSALAVGQNSIWVLCAKEGKVDRIDPKTNKVAKTIELGVPGAGDMAFGEGSLWVTQPGFPVTRIDPDSEKVVQQFWGEGGGVIAAGAKAIWLGNVKQGSVWRLDPKRIAATLAE